MQDLLREIRVPPAIETVNGDEVAVSRNNFCQEGLSRGELWWRREKGGEQCSPLMVKMDDYACS